MKFKNLLSINLRLFDGGAGGTSGGAGAAASGDGGTMGDTQSDSPGNTRRGGVRGARSASSHSGEINGASAQGNGAAASGLVDQAQAQLHAAGEAESRGTQNVPSTLEERRKAFRDMVNGEYKDVFAEETQKHINRRFSETRTLEAKVQAQQPVIDMLMQRYKIGDGDVQKLTQAVENDDAYWFEAAEEAGMSVEQYKQFQKLKRDNAALLAAQKGRQQQDAIRQQSQKWFLEAQEVKAKFPKFDLTQELQDPTFVSMLRAGTPVEHAYKVRHFDELMESAMQVTAVNTEKRTTDNIKARGNRPAENGTSSQSAFTTKGDVHALDKKARAEIARRALRGEKVTF